MSKTKIIINAILLFVVFYVVKCNVEETKEREMLVQIDAACEKNDFETAYKIISELDIINNSESYKKRKAVTEKEVLYLVRLNSEDASNRIVYLLTENFHFESKPYPEGIYQGSDLDRYKLRDYNSEVSSLNNYCDKIFSLAASQGNKYLCLKLLFFYQEILKDEIISTQSESQSVATKTEDEEISGIETTIEEERFQKATHSITYVNTAKESSIEKYKDFFGEDPKIDENNTISD